MSGLPVALAPPANLAEVLDRIAAMDRLPRQKRHDLMSAVRQVARLLGGLLADVPANPEALRRRLNLVTPAAAGMTRTRWRNVRALLAAALELDRGESCASTGVSLAGRRPGLLCTSAPATAMSERACSRFFGYCVGERHRTGSSQRSDRRRFRREPEAQFPARAPNPDRARSVPRVEPLRRKLRRLAGGAIDRSQSPPRLCASADGISGVLRRRRRSLPRPSRQRRSLRRDRPARLQSHNAAGRSASPFSDGGRARLFRPGSARRSDRSPTWSHPRP